MLTVEKSDIDQLVLGYIAEERYIQTRNQLFRESPNLPEKVPILSIFGDISSENRLHKILQEYVQLKTRQLVPLCAVCDHCNSLSAMWKAFDVIAQKIRNYKPPEPQQPSPMTSMPELQLYSPSHIWHGTRKGKSCETGNDLEVTETTLHRKKLNPLSNEYETVSIEGHKSTCGSARRKNFSVPRRIQHPTSEILEPYAHNGDLSKLLHTSDKNDALALVGVKILSNMKKCAEKGSSGAWNTPCKVNSAATPLLEPAIPFSPLKSSYGPALDIDDLISDEARGDLVEMTIDSILNPHIPGPSRMTSISNNCGDEDFSELRKLLEFDNTSSSSLTIPNLIQIQQDEMDLIEIIKSDDNLDLPENPIPMVYEGNQLTTEQSEDEKNAVAGLLAIQSSSNDATSMEMEEHNKTQNTCTTPTISKVRPESYVGDVLPSPTRDICPNNRENIENTSATATEVEEQNTTPTISKVRSESDVADVLPSPTRDICPNNRENIENTSATATEVEEHNKTQDTCTTPTISKVRSESDVGDVLSSPTRDICPNNRENIENTSATATEVEEHNKTQSTCTTPTISKVRSESEVADVLPSPTRDMCPNNSENIDNSAAFLETNMVPEIQSTPTVEGILDSCATMPPKKRFLVQETRTPNKYLNQNLTTFTSPQNKRIQITENLTEVNSVLSPKESNLTATNQQIAILPEPSLTLTTTADSIASAEAIEDHPIRTDSRNESDLMVTSATNTTHDSSKPVVRRSKRLHKPNFALRDLIRKPRALSKRKNSCDGTAKENVTSIPNESPTNSNMSKTSSSLSTVLKRGQGSVVINLKDRGRMPIHVSGIIVQSKNDKLFSKEDIISQLVNQVQKDKHKMSPTVDASRINVQDSGPQIQIDGLNSQSSEGNTTPGQQFPTAPNIHTQPPPPVSEFNDAELVQPLNASQSQTLELLGSQVDTAETVVPNLTMDLLGTHETDALETQIPLTPTLPSTSADQELDIIGSPNMPISEGSLTLLAILDIADPGEISKTPSKPHQQREFSTISPGDIFSVINRSISSPKLSQLASVKSRLLTSFLEEEGVKGINSKDVDFANQNDPPGQTSSFQYAELTNVSGTRTSSNAHLDETVPATSIPSLPAPCVTSKLAGSSKTSKSVPPALKRNIGKSKPDLGKCALLQNRARSGGVMMCSKMKNMVRIEPKRQGIPAVKRYIVQGGEGSGEQAIVEANLSIVQNRSESRSVTTRNPKSSVFDDRTSKNIAAEEMGRVRTKECEENSSSPSTRHKPDGEDTETQAKANKRPETASTPKKLKRKIRRKSPEKKKRLKLSKDSSPVMRWTYNEIQSKLDSIHGKNKSENKKGTENSTPIKNAQIENGVVLEGHQDKETPLRIVSDGETHCKDDVHGKYQSENKKGTENSTRIQNEQVESGVVLEGHHDKEIPLRIVSDDETHCKDNGDVHGKNKSENKKGTENSTRIQNEQVESGVVLEGHQEKEIPLRIVSDDETHCKDNGDVHGKNKSENKKGTENSTPIENEQVESGVVLEGHQAKEFPLYIVSETHCKDDCSVSFQEKDHTAEKVLYEKQNDSTRCGVDVAEPTRLVLHENVQTIDGLLNVQSENPDLYSLLPVSRAPDKRVVEMRTSGEDPVLNIAEESPWLPFDVNQIEPLDLSLTSWLCNSKSPFKNLPNLATSVQPGVPTVTKLSDAQLADTTKHEPLLKDVPHKNSKHRKRTGKKKSSKRFKRLEEKIKKVDLKNMDISKFLDSLEYHET